MDQDALYLLLHVETDVFLVSAWLENLSKDTWSIYDVQLNQLVHTTMCMAM